MLLVMMMMKIMIMISDIYYRETLLQEWFSERS